MYSSMHAESFSFIVKAEVFYSSKDAVQLSVLCWQLLSYWLSPVLHTTSSATDVDLPMNLDESTHNISVCQ